MAKAKYYDKIRAAQSGETEPEDGPDRPFSFSDLAPEGRWAQIRGKLTQRAIPYLHAFSRRHRPMLSVAGLLHITRAEQVRDILSRPQDFPVPFGPEMKELGEGATFLLGLDGAEHDRLHAILLQVLLREDAPRIRDMAERFADALLDNSAGEIDAVADLMKRVPTEICLRYFGLTCVDPDLFADWTLAVSAVLFGDPYGDPTTRRLALQAGKRLRAVISDAVARHRQVLDRGPSTIAERSTLVERLLLVQRSDPTLTDEEITAMLLGLAAGFVPTNTLAGSKMLTELLGRPNALRMAGKAARAGDADTMRKIVLEAGRLNPALAPGQWRHTDRATTLMVDGEAKVIPADITLLVATQSALRDPREWDEPERFRIDRTKADGSPQHPDLIFGLGSHTCLGEHHAVAQISGCFTALLRREGVTKAPGKAGKLESVGPFPRHLTLRYGHTGSQQSMFLVIAPVTDGSTKEQVEATIGTLGHPAKDAVRNALDSTNRVHFASLIALESERGLDVVFELSCDGKDKETLRTIEEYAGDLLRPVFAHCGVREGQALAPFMERHIVRLHLKPWGATGLNVNGLPEFPVAAVARQARFADFAKRVLDDYVASETARGSHPSLTLGHLRRILRDDPLLRAEATPNQLALMEEAQREGWDAYHLATQRMRLGIAGFEKPSGWGEIAKRFLTSRDALALYVPAGAVLLLASVACWFALGGAAPMRWLIAPLLGLLTGSLMLAAMVGVFLWMLRREEMSNTPTSERATMPKMRHLMGGEDHPGYAQNHVLAVGTLKRGWFRSCIHAGALWGIKSVLAHAMRPGFIWSMGTIHYARWWRLPGTRRVAFYSNFDGSWESYLEDFIVRGGEGQTAAWSNWEGFPETRFLLWKGSKDSDAFKNFTRTVQRVAPFWYARFAEMSSATIRTNGQIHVGAGLARSSTEAEEWIRCFGSMPRTANRVESDEVQALVFRGMKRLPYSVSLAIELPQEAKALGEWLCWVRGRPMRIDRLVPRDAQQALSELLAQQVIERVPRGDGQEPEYALSHALSIAFGDRPLMGFGQDGGHASQAMGQAAFLALSAAGLAKFDAPGLPSGTLLAGLPPAFRMGMAARKRVTGDYGEDDPDGWRWHDHPHRLGATDAVLMLYAADRPSLERMLTVHDTLLQNHGGKVLQRTNCAPAFAETERTDFEHFGFRDGISQPVMRGTTRSTRGVPERDVVEPGEFIIGYPNDTGYLPESPCLPADADIAGALPVVIDANLTRFTDFGAASLADAPRDLGRNGSFLVIRELAQDVEGFEAGMEAAAKQLSQGGYRDLYKLLGQHPDAEWVGAKMMGRWKDGRPLVGNPVAGHGSAHDDPACRENDFSYALDDPQGLACPFGSHIRRSNPRDSKVPDEREGEQDITNRHRILRRGRPYTRADGKGGVEKGLLFACLCTDIERQFEFVQQFWANAPAFHGLANEPDPIIGADPVSTREGETRPRGFTIPTTAGPVRLEGLKKYVTAKGGGYFFLPSRSALGWLSDTALRQSASQRPTGKAGAQT
ncbi:cytochrome P450 [Qipengyuania sp. DSG2-2]|uniref:cytochrome P450 n=1 Tax=Qipengyuania sp. DGS2-2 TaxID=3349631 RepID=UPI0036D25126